MVQLQVQVSAEGRLKVLLYPQQKEVKRGVSKVYLALKYLEDNIYNVHLQSLH